MALDGIVLATSPDTAPTLSVLTVSISQGLRVTSRHTRASWYEHTAE